MMSTSYKHLEWLRPNCQCLTSIDPRIEQQGNCYSNVTYVDRKDGTHAFHSFPIFVLLKPQYQNNILILWIGLDCFKFACSSCISRLKSEYLPPCQSQRDTGFFSFQSFVLMWQPILKVHNIMYLALGFIEALHMLELENTSGVAVFV